MEHRGEGNGGQAGERCRQADDDRAALGKQASTGPDATTTLTDACPRVFRLRARRDHVVCACARAWHRRRLRRPAPHGRSAPPRKPSLRRRVPVQLHEVLPQQALRPEAARLQLVRGGELRRRGRGARRAVTSLRHGRGATNDVWCAAVRERSANEVVLRPDRAPQHRPQQRTCLGARSPLPRASASSREADVR